MVRKNYKWSISKEDGEKLINETLKEILESKGEMEISDLKLLLQNRNIIIKNNNKNKNIINFIKNVFGGLINFLENRKDIYTIKNDIDSNIKIINININKSEITEDIYFLNDWIIVK